MPNEAQNPKSKITAEGQLKEFDEELKRKKEALRPSFWNYVFLRPSSYTFFWHSFPDERKKLFIVMVDTIIIGIVISLVYLILRSFFFVF